MINKLEIGRFEAYFNIIKLSYFYQKMFCFTQIEQSFIESNAYKDIISDKTALEYFEKIKNIASNFDSFGSIIYGSDKYPKKLLDLKDKLFLLYFLGNYELINKPSIAIIGSRNASFKGLKRASKITKMLVKNGFVIISGLAEGIDTAVHKACIEENGKTIAVIGTPLNHCYPASNKSLMQEMAKNHLLISQIPFIRYNKMDLELRKKFFPERNKTMSALANATLIIEARDKSGTLTQARAALEQGRPLFILNNNFDNPNLEWPHEFEAMGAIRVNRLDDILINISY